MTLNSTVVEIAKMRARCLLFLFCFLLLLVISFSPVTAETSDGVNVPTNQFVFGVYTAWETTYIPGYTDTPANRAENLTPFLTTTFFPVLTANNSFNLVWTTDGPEAVNAEVSEFSAAAQQFGVMTINGSDGDFYLEASQNSNSFITSALGVLENLWNGATTKPFAFSIADEPPAAEAAQLASYVSQAQAANLPVTTVLAPGTASAILGSVKTLPWVSFDRYPFFDDPRSGPTGNGSYSYFLAMAQDIGTAYKNGNPQVWAMGQAFQGVEGNYVVNSNGTVTVSAGSGLEWVMPTPAQVSWEAWAAAAMGAKGVIFFTYSQIPQWVATVNSPPPAHASWAFRNGYNTGSYPGLASFPGYNPGPQLLQLQNQTIPDIRSIQNILLASHTLISAPPKPTPVSFAGNQLPGDYINFLGASGGVIYVAVVSSPQRTSGSITLSLNKAVQSLVPMGNAPPLAMSRGKVMLALPPGGGALYQVIEGQGVTSGGNSSGGNSSAVAPQAPSSGQPPSPPIGVGAGGSDR
ncbi:MAG TPA: hypothetical protein VGP76_12740 [Planctomycetaceae bacterium]|nr:hypothetical protein [Planctomycetaceae bacterium]